MLFPKEVATYTWHVVAISALTMGGLWIGMIIACTPYPSNFIRVHQGRDKAYSRFPEPEKPKSKKLYPDLDLTTTIGAFQEPDDKDPGENNQQVLKILQKEREKEFKKGSKTVCKAMRH